MIVDPAELLRERGIYVTAQRLAVMRVVTAHPHVTADIVATEVRRELGAISLQSVYDALSVLADEGLLRRIQPAGSAALYEDRVGDNHHHLICRLCGRVVDVDCASGKAPCLNASHKRGYEIDEAEVAYWGRCPECRAAAPVAQVPQSRRGADKAATKITNKTSRSSTPWKTNRSARSQEKRKPAARTRTGGRTT